MKKEQPPMRHISLTLTEPLAQAIDNALEGRQRRAMIEYWLRLNTEVKRSAVDLGIEFGPRPKKGPKGPRAKK